MEQSIMLLIILLFGVILIGILIFLIPLINQLKKTAQQLEQAASSLDKILNNDLKAFLNRGEKVLEDWEEDIQPLIMEKVKHIPSAATQFGFSKVGGQILRVLILWAVKEAWGKIRGGKKGKNH